MKFVNTTTRTLSSSSSSSSFLIFSDVGDDSVEIIIESSFGRPTTDGDGSKDDRTREELREAALSRFFFREEKGESVLEEAQEEDIFISFRLRCVTLLTLECKSTMALFKEGRDAMSARKPPGAIDGKAVVFAFFAATVYFSCALRKNSSSTSSRGSASSSSSGKKTSALETDDDDAKARWYVPSNR